VSYKDKIITFPLFNTCYPPNLARNLASFSGTGILKYNRLEFEDNIDLILERQEVTTAKSG